MQGVLRNIIDAVPIAVRSALVIIIHEGGPSMAEFMPQLYLAAHFFGTVQIDVVAIAGSIRRTDPNQIGRFRVVEGKAEIGPIVELFLPADLKGIRLFRGQGRIAMVSIGRFGIKLIKARRIEGMPKGSVERRLWVGVIFQHKFWTEFRIGSVFVALVGSRRPDIAVIFFVMIKAQAQIDAEAVVYLILVGEKERRHQIVPAHLSPVGGDGRMIVPMRQTGLDVIHGIALKIKAGDKGVHPQIPCLLQIQFIRLAGVVRVISRPRPCQVITSGVAALFHMRKAGVDDELIMIILILQGVPVSNPTAVIVRKIRLIKVIISCAEEHTAFKEGISCRVHQI